MAAFVHVSDWLYCRVFQHFFSSFQTTIKKVECHWWKGHLKFEHLHCRNFGPLSDVRFGQIVIRVPWWNLFGRSISLDISDVSCTLKDLGEQSSFEQFKQDVNHTPSHQKWYAQSEIERYLKQLVALFQLDCTDLKIHFEKPKLTIRVENMKSTPEETNKTGVLTLMDKQLVLSNISTHMSSNETFPIVTIPHVGTRCLVANDKISLDTTVPKIQLYQHFWMSLLDAASVGKETKTNSLGGETIHSHHRSLVWFRFAVEQITGELPVEDKGNQIQLRSDGIQCHGSLSKMVFGCRSFKMEDETGAYLTLMNVEWDRESKVVVRQFEMGKIETWTAWGRRLFGKSECSHRVVSGRLDKIPQTPSGRSKSNLSIQIDKSKVIYSNSLTTILENTRLQISNDNTCSCQCQMVEVWMTYASTRLNHQHQNHRFLTIRHKVVDISSIEATLRLDDQPPQQSPKPTGDRDQNYETFLQMEENETQTSFAEVNIQTLCCTLVRTDWLEWSHTIFPSLLQHFGVGATPGSHRDQQQGKTIPVRANIRQCTFDLALYVDENPDVPLPRNQGILSGGAPLFPRNQGCHFVPARWGRMRLPRIVLCHLKVVSRNDSTSFHCNAKQSNERTRIECTDNPQNWIVLQEQSTLLVSKDHQRPCYTFWLNSPRVGAFSVIALDHLSQFGYFFAPTQREFQDIVQSVDNKHMDHKHSKSPPSETQDPDPVSRLQLHTWPRVLFNIQSTTLVDSELDMTIQLGFLKLDTLLQPMSSINLITLTWDTCTGWIRKEQWLQITQMKMLLTSKIPRHAKSAFDVSQYHVQVTANTKVVVTFTQDSLQWLVQNWALKHSQWTKEAIHKEREQIPLELSRLTSEPYVLTDQYFAAQNNTAVSVTAEEETESVMSGDWHPDTDHVWNHFSGTPIQKDQDEAPVARWITTPTIHNFHMAARPTDANIQIVNGQSRDSRIHVTLPEAPPDAQYSVSDLHLELRLLLNVADTKKPVELLQLQATLSQLDCKTWHDQDQWVYLCINNLEILDQYKASSYRKLLMPWSEWSKVSHHGEIRPSNVGGQRADMYISAEWHQKTHTKACLHPRSSTFRLHVCPLKLHLHEEILTALSAFLKPDNQRSAITTKTTPTTTTTTTVAASDHIIDEFVILHDIPLSIHFRPLSLLPEFEHMQITLSKKQYRAVESWSTIATQLQTEWSTETSKHLIGHAVGGLQFVRPWIQMMKGFWYLFAIPWNHYVHQHGRLSTGLRRGLHTFSDHTLGEGLDMTSRIAGSVKHTAQRLHRYLRSKPIPTAKRTATTSSAAVLPQNYSEGLEMAWSDVQHELHHVNRELIEKPKQRWNRSEWKAATKQALIAGAMAVSIAPVVMISGAIEKSSFGAAASLTPLKHQQAQNKYKSF